MIKKILSILIVLFSASVYSNNYMQKNSVRCDSELTEILETVKKLPEVHTLLAQVLEKGPLSIQVNRDPNMHFEGFWFPGDRIISITPSSKGQMITTLLFELHNAQRGECLNSLYNSAISGEVGKEQFVELVECYEYQNAWSTIYLLELGIERNIFPLDCRWELSPTFEEHLQVQKSAGHSAWIAEVMYEQIIKKA